jgi:multimeric flavodoxin WrbA
MEVIILMGSRNPEGKTAEAANAMLQGISDEGGKGEMVFLPEMTIERCRQCEANGWGICREQGKCIIEEDDFASLVDKIRNADAVVFANPVYFGGLSESLEAFLNRLRRICIHDDGKVGISGKPCVGICLAGGGGRGAPTCAVSLEKQVGLCGFDLVDIIPARKQNLDLKLDVLKTTGRWFAKSGWKLAES